MVYTLDAHIHTTFAVIDLDGESDDPHQLTLSSDGSLSGMSPEQLAYSE